MRRTALLTFFFAACSSPHGTSQPGTPDGGAITPSDAALVGSNGGSDTLDELRFAVVGDTRPPNIDDTADYPTAIITKIWQDVEAESPHPPFAVSTGDYMFAEHVRHGADPQLELYLPRARAFTGMLYPAMGNHECTGATASNCGPGAADGITKNYDRLPHDDAAAARRDDCRTTRRRSPRPTAAGPRSSCSSPATRGTPTQAALARRARSPSRRPTRSSCATRATRRCRQTPCSPSQTIIARTR